MAQRAQVIAQAVTCPLGRARGSDRYNLLARAIDNKPFQCSDGFNPPQRQHSAARVEQGDLLFIARASRLYQPRPRARAGNCSSCYYRCTSRTFYANVRWSRRPGPWPGAEAVTDSVPPAVTVTHWQTRVSSGSHVRVLPDPKELEQPESIIHRNTVVIGFGSAALADSIIHRGRVSHP